MTKENLERRRVMLRALAALVLLSSAYMFVSSNNCRPLSDPFSASASQSGNQFAILKPSNDDGQSVMPSPPTKNETTTLATQNPTKRSSPPRPTGSLPSTSSSISAKSEDPKEAAFELAIQRYQIRQQQQATSNGTVAIAYKDLQELAQSDDKTEILNLIRIPKAGSSALSMVARALVGCQPDGYPCCGYPGNPPGSCPIPDLMCPRVRGCVRHRPKYHDNGKIMATIISLREPVQRMISGWFYFGMHRPKPDSDHSWAMFENEYAGTTNYSNPMVKMLIGKQPYQPMPLIRGWQVKRAKNRLCKITWFSIAKQYEISAALLLYETGVFRQIQPKSLIFGLPANYTISGNNKDGEDVMNVAEGQEQRKRRRQLASDSGTRVNESEEYANWKAKYQANATELMKRTNAPDLEVYDFALKLLAARVKENQELVSAAKAANKAISDEIDELLSQHWDGTVLQLCSQE